MVCQSKTPAPQHPPESNLNPNGAAAQAPSPAKRHPTNKSNVTAGEGRGEGETAAWSVKDIDRAIVCPQSVVTDLQVCQPKSQPQRRSRASPLSRETTSGQQVQRDCGRGWGEGETAAPSVSGIDGECGWAPSVVTDLQVCQSKPTGSTLLETNRRGRSFNTSASQG